MRRSKGVSERVGFIMLVVGGCDCSLVIPREMWCPKDPGGSLTVCSKKSLVVLDVSPPIFVRST